MNYQEFIDILKKQVLALTDKRKLEFALVVCKKLYFDYQKFYDIEKWGDPELLMDAIRMCEHRANTVADKAKYEAMKKRVETITPDTNDFGTCDGSYALNACASLLHTLDFILNNDPVEILSVGIAYYDTWDFKVQEDNALNEQQIDQHPLMIETKRFLLEQTK